VARAQTARRAVGAAHRRVTRWWAFSPLDMVSTRLFRRLGDDRVLPNEYARGTRTLALPDGRAMIIRRYELQPALDGRSPADAPPMADDVARWRDSLAARGIATRVLLIPSRYTVYGSRLEEHGRRAAPRSVAAYVDQVADELRARGIPTLNALALFRDVAADELRTGALSFYREDNHWNARGVTRVAEVLADSLAVWDAAAPARPRK
jgi:hypothetical protein